MRIAPLAAVLAAFLVACVHPKPGYFSAQKQAPAVKPVAPTARPFVKMPWVELVDQVQTGPIYRVQIAAEITRDVIPTDDLAIVVSVDDHEVGRYPIVGKYKGRPTKIKQEIELPLGDYEIDYVYQGDHFAGMPFRLAEVPVWGGRTALQLRAHQGTRVSLREKKLWVGRWWANDGPAQAWIIEWARDGQVITTTSGTEAVGIPPEARGLVGGAAGAFRAEKIVQNTIWTYGEEYPLPDVVAQQPGAWAARVVHGSSAPVAVVFTVTQLGTLVEASSRKVMHVGWEPSWSKRLDARSLSVTEVDRLTAKLPHTSSTQPFDEPRTDGIEPAVRVSPAAVRALFRSKQLAESWWEFLSLNRSTPATLTAQPAAFVKGSQPANARRDAAASAKQDAERRTKLRKLRAQIDELIKTQGFAWKPDEHPHS
ncbi:MAG TPA: hypothetical protein VMZ53_23390 [Kofleriaceae bacterium]|nr:hypothetical protein [Kofleriaceae bacterium]